MGGGTQNVVEGHDLTVTASRIGILNSAALTVDRATITGGQNGIQSNSGSLALTNVLIHGTSGAAIVTTQTTGRFSFGTIANTGTANVEAPALRCVAGGGLTVDHSILWTVTTTSKPAIEGPCPVTDSIVGPVGMVGADNRDPLFVDPFSDFRLNAGSPARDRSDTGPSFDFEGTARPQGARFDWGADETL